MLRWSAKRLLPCCVSFWLQGADVVARVQICNISDEFIKDFGSAFTVGQRVKGRVISLDREARKCEFSLRKVGRMLDFCTLLTGRSRPSQLSRSCSLRTSKCLAHHSCVLMLMLLQRHEAVRQGDARQGLRLLRLV